MAVDGTVPGTSVSSAAGRSSNQRAHEPGIALAKFNMIIGGLGSYEIFTCFIILLSGVTCAWQTMSFVFVTKDVDYKCIIANLTPCDPDCPEIIYPGVMNGSNIIQQWNLVCDNEIKAQLTQSILLLGFMVGCILFGHLADQYGRRPCFLAACMFMLVTGFLVYVTPWYWLYCFSKFFLGLGCGGQTICSLVFIVEYVELEKREIMVVMYQLPYAVGYSTLPVFAFFMPKWRDLQLGTTGLGLVFVSYFWFLPESPRWLLLMGYVDKCVEVLQSPALNKGIPHAELRQIVKAAHYDLIAEDALYDGTMVDLFRTRNLCKKTCILCFAWFTLYFKFYGISDYVGFISTNIYLNFGVGAFLMVVGTLVAYPVIKLVTRRKALLSTYGLSALCLFAIPIFTNIHSHVWIAALSTVVIPLASISFVNIQLFSTELFPTVLRNSGMGLSICIGRFGSVISPFVLDAHVIYYWLPALLYAILSAIVAFMVLLLPETKGEKLPDTIEEGENFGKKTRSIE